MSSEVVARRWRPLTFDSVVGQSHITKTLANAIERDRVPHAFLFAGIRGVGKTTVARLLARALNCQGGNGAEPCNQCSPCEQNLAGSAIDVIEIDGASNRGIDEVRSLIEAAQYRPAQGRFKVYIVDEVHQLTREAFNALLKTLEEPPEHVKFIMATTEAQKLPPTVLSRCQRYDFRRISSADINAHLAHIAAEDGLSISAPALALITREADGSMRDAQSLLEQVLAGSQGEVDDDEVARLLGIAGRGLVASFVESILRGEADKIVGLVAEVRHYGHDAEKLVGEILEVLRHVAVARAAGLKALDDSLGEDTKKLAASLADLREQLDLQRIFSSVLDTSAELRRTSHPDLVLEMGLLKVASLEPVSTAAEVLARLEQIDSSGSAAKGSGSGGGERGGGSGRGRRSSGGGQRSGGPSDSGPPNAPSGGGGSQRGAGPGAASRSAGAQRVGGPGLPSGSGAHGAPTERDASAAPAQGFPSRNDLPRQSDGAAPSGDSRPAALPPQTAREAVSPGPAVAENIPTLDADDEEAPTPWEAFLERVRQQCGLDLYVTLTNCEVLSLTDTLLELKAVGGAMGATLRNPTVMRRVRELAVEHFGAGMEVRISDRASAAGVSVQGLEDDRAARACERAREDPLVRRAVEQHGGKIANISLLED